MCRWAIAEGLIKKPAIKRVDSSKIKNDSPKLGSPSLLGVKSDNAYSSASWIVVVAAITALHVKPPKHPSFGVF